MNAPTRHLTIACTALALAAGCRSSEVRSADNTATTHVAVPATASHIPADTTLRVRLNDTLSTETSQPGDQFTASVIDNVMAENGEVAIPAGAVVTGTVRTVDPSDRIGDQASVELNFDTIALQQGSPLPMQAAIIDADVEESRSGSGVAKGAGAGALGGAALGAILGGGSGALKGGLIGAGAGTLISLGAGDVQATLPMGTPMTLRLTAPLETQGPSS